MERSVSDFSEIPLKPDNSERGSANDNEESTIDDAQQFSSRWAFWLSACGCAIGFGNLWRFPYLVYEHGGAVFLIVYLLMLALIVWPLSIFEFGIGQLSKGGNVKAFRAVHRRVASVGWGFLTAVNVLQFYPLLISWALMYFVNSFKKDMPWYVSDLEKLTCSEQTTIFDCANYDYCTYDVAASKCEAFVLTQAKDFFENTLGAKEEYWEGITEFKGWIFFCELISWVLIFLSTVGGAKILGYINYVITTVPAFLLIILVVVGATLDGAGEGIKEYIGKFDVDSLKSTRIWTDAASQGMFSMGATQGTMTGYSSHNVRNQNFVQDTYVVIFGDTFFAIVAGFAVFSVIGFLSFDSGIAIVDLPIQGTGLAFQTYPVGLAQGLPYPAAQIVSVLFFLTLWLLGMSSAVALLDAAALVIVESKVFKRSGFKRWQAYIVICSVMFSFAFLYSTDMGKHLLDCLDGFTAIFSFLWVASCLSTSAGWFTAWDMYVERAGKNAVLLHLTTYIGGAALGSILLYGISDGGAIAGPVVGLCIMLGGFIGAWFITRKDEPGTNRTLSPSERTYNLTMFNVQQARAYFNSVACRDTIWRVPRVWSFCIKYVTPVLSILLFFASLMDPYQMYSRPLSDDSPPGAVTYPWYVFFLGNITPYLLFFGSILFFIFPFTMEWIYPEKEVEFVWGTEGDLLKVGEGHKKKVVAAAVDLIIAAKDIESVPLSHKSASSPSSSDSSSSSES